MEDREIVALYWSRSEQALAETEARYGSYCRAIALRVLNSEQDAEECVNDAYLDVWNRIPPQKPDALGAFLGKIVRHIAIDRLRRRSAKKRGGGETPLALDELAACLPDRDGVEQTLERKALTELLNRFLAGLEQTERAVFLRRYWYIEPVGVYRDFLQTNANYFGGAAYRGSFADAQTLQTLADWAGVPLKLPDSGVALYGKMAFSGTWETPFLRADEVVDGVFRAADGTERAVQYLSQERRMPYLIGDGFYGGVLSYEEGYDFVLLQPWEGRWADVYDFASALTPSAVAEAVAECSSSWVDLKVPKFTAHAETSLPGVLSALGVEKLFGAGALSAMVSGDASLSAAVQTLSVSVGELGTEALAADRLIPVEPPVSVSGTSPVVSEPEWLHLESPFVYLIVERETDLPVIMGIYAGN